MPPQLSVREFMSGDVLTLSPDAVVEDAVTALAERGISGAPVCDESGQLVGLLDDHDLILSEARIHAPSAIEILGAYIPVPGTVQRFEDEVRHALAGTVGDLMRKDPPAVTAEQSLEDVATLMADHDVSRVPVIDDHRRVIGIVSRGDLVTAMSRR